MTRHLVCLFRPHLWQLVNDEGIAVEAQKCLRCGARRRTFRDKAGRDYGGRRGDPRSDFGGLGGYGG
jgi:hypothetical protein